MTGVLTLLVGSALAGWHGHRPLWWLAARGVDPTVLLTGWLLAGIGLVISAVSMASLWALPTDDHPSAGLFSLAGGCWTALSSGALPGWREAMAGASILVGATVLGRVGWAVHGRLRTRRVNVAAMTQLRQLAAGVPAGQPLEVRDDRPLAVSIGGRPGIIVISDALRRHLSPAALAATLAHERAHLRGQHHVLIGIVETLAVALPRVPLLRAAPEAVRDLVELAADRAAARHCGAPAVHEALVQVSAAPHVRPPGPALALTGEPRGLHMASRLTAQRLVRLQSPTRMSAPAPRALACLAVAAAALALPGATGWIVLNTLGCVVT